MIRIAFIKHSKAVKKLFFFSCNVLYTVMILSFRADRPGQTVQTQIRLLLESTLFAIPSASFGLITIW